MINRKTDRELENIKMNQQDYKNKAKKCKRDAFISLGAAALLFLTGTACQYEASQIGTHPEKNLFISAGEYAENYQGNNPQEVLAYLNEMVTGYTQDFQDKNLSRLNPYYYKKENDKQSKLLILRDLMDKSNKLENDLLGSSSRAVRLQVNNLGRNLKEIGNGIPDGEGYGLGMYLAFTGALACAGGFFGYNIDLYRQNMKEVKFYEKKKQDLIASKIEEGMREDD